MGDHNPRDLSVFVGIRGRGARPGAPENPLMPIDPKPRPRLADARRAHVIVSHGQGDHNAEPLQAETYEASVKTIGYKLGPVLKH